jgi:hypothetical protein
MASRTKERGEGAVIPTRFSPAEVRRMERVRGMLGMASRSAFIRAAVLEKVAAIEDSKIVEVRDVTEAEAIRLMDRYLQKNPGVHQVDDIADELGLELKVAFGAARRLLDRGRARVREA